VVFFSLISLIAARKAIFSPIIFLFEVWTLANGLEVDLFMVFGQNCGFVM
jgi:hypothetical protein